MAENEKPDFNSEAAEGTLERDGITMTELIYGTLFHPVKTFRKVGENPPVFKSFLVFSIVVIVNLLVSISLAPHTLAKNAVPMVISDALQGTVPFLAVIGTVFTYINWIVLAGILHLFAELFEGKGSALGVMSVMGLIQLPKLVAIPFQVVGTVVNQAFISTFLSVLGGLVYLLWWSILIVLGIREVHGLTTGKALAVLSVPVFLVGLAVIIIFIAGMGLMVPLLNILSGS